MNGETQLEVVVELTHTAIGNLEAKLAQKTDECELWFDLVCGFIEESDDSGLLRRAMDAVEQSKDAQ